MMFWYGHDPGGWGWFAMSVGMVVFWALLIAVAVLLFRALSQPSGSKAPNGRSSPGPPPNSSWRSGSPADRSKRTSTSVG